MTVSIKAKSLSPYRPTIDEHPPEKTTRDNSQDIVVAKKITPKSINTIKPESNARPGAITPKASTRTISKLPDDKKRPQQQPLLHQQQHYQHQQPLEKKMVSQTGVKDESSRLRSHIQELESKIAQYQLERKDLSKKIDQLQQQNNYYKTETEDLSKQVESLMKLYETINNDKRTQHQPQDKRVV